LDPDGLVANYLGSVQAGMIGDLSSARTRLDKAHAAGLPDDDYQRVRRMIDDAATPLPSHSTEDSSEFPISSANLYLALWIFLGWLATMGVLLVAGFVLSRMTLRAAKQAAVGTEGHRRLRKIYKIVLVASGLYFYLSVPILLALVVVAGG